MQEALDHERSAREEGEHFLHQLQEALDHERSPRQQGEQLLRGVQEELDRERSAREQAERRYEQAEPRLRGVQEELERERSAREQAEQRLRGVQEELEGERSAREQAERRLREEGRPSASAGPGGLWAAGISISAASRSELAAATQNFAPSRILGRGGFGPLAFGKVGSAPSRCSSRCRERSNCE